MTTALAVLLAMLLCLGAVPPSIAFDLELQEMQSEAYPPRERGQLINYEESRVYEQQERSQILAHSGANSRYRSVPALLKGSIHPLRTKKHQRRRLRDSRINQVTEIVMSQSFPEHVSIFFDQFCRTQPGFGFALSGLNANNLHIVNFKNVEEVTVDSSLKLGDSQLYAIKYNAEETLAVAVIGNTLKVIQIDLEHLQISIVGELELTARLQHLHFSEDSKFIYGKQKGVKIQRIDITKPFKPKYSGSVSFPGVNNLYTFEIVDGAIVASIYYKGVVIVDISDDDFENSKVVAVVNSGIRNRFIVPTADNTILLVTDLFQGLKIIDIKNKTNPVVMSTFVARQQFQDVELRKPQLIFNDSLAVLNTYQRYIVILDIKDREKPKVLGHFDSTKTLQFFSNQEMAFDFSKGNYELYNMTKVFMVQKELITTLPETIMPITRSPVLINGYSEIKLTSRISFHSEANLLIYVKTELFHQTEVQFFNTSTSLTNPKLISIYYPHEDPEESKNYQWDIQWKRDRPVLNLCRGNFVNDTIELELVDIGNLEAPAFLGKMELFLSKPGLTPHLADVSVFDNPDFVSVGFVQDNVQIINVRDPSDMSVVTRIGGWDGRVTQIEIRNLNGTDVLFLMSPVALRLHNVTLGYFTPLISLVEFSQTDGNFTFQNDSMVLIGGEKEGIHYVDITDLRLPKLVKNIDLSSIGISPIRVIPVEDEKMLVMSLESFSYVDFAGVTPRVLGSFEIGVIRSFTQIQGDPKTFFMSAKGQNYNEYVSLVQLGYPYLLYFDDEAGNQNQLQLGDSYKFLDLYPMTKVAGLLGQDQDRYIDIWEKYSFINIAMYDKFLNKHVTAPFPNWITPDFSNFRIQLNLDIPEALGISYLHSVVSLEVPDDAFVGIDTIDNLIRSIDLKKSLIRQGYMERNFLSSRYDPEVQMHLENEFVPSDGIVSREIVANITNDDLYLQLVQGGYLQTINETSAILNQDYSQRTLYIQLYYNKFNKTHYSMLEAYFKQVKEGMTEPKIRARLKDFYIEVVGELRIEESLSILLADNIKQQEGKAINIQTKAKTLVKAEIQILESVNCSRFIDDKLGILTEAHSMIAIEGSTTEVNKALQELRVDRAFPEARCRAEVTVNDNLNPIQKITLDDIGEVTILNEAPSFAIPLQKAFSMMYPNNEVEFDSSFELEPKPVDSEADELSYVIEIKEEGEDDASYTLLDFIDWIHADPETGKITGHPSEASVFKQFRIKYTVSDGYKDFSDEFKIKIMPTPWYFFSIAIKYASGIVFTFGMWKYRDDLYAIIFKKKYRYPAEMQAFVGKNFEMIIPIIRLELEASNPIVEHMVRLGLARMPSRWYRNKQAQEWISAYFSEKGFHIMAFLNDLNSFPMQNCTEAESVEAFTFLGHRIVHYAYEQAAVDYDQLILALLEHEIDNERNWTKLRVKIFDYVSATRSGKMQIGMLQFSENIKIVLGFRERSFFLKKGLRFLFPVLRAFNAHLVQLPLPTSMPVWLKCEVDSAFIKLSGLADEEYSNQKTFIRVYDSSNYIIREFEITVEQDRETLQNRLSNKFSQMLKDKENIQLQAIKQYVVAMSQDYQQRSLSGSTFGKKSSIIRTSLCEEEKQNTPETIYRTQGSLKKTGDMSSAQNLLDSMSQKISHVPQIENGGDPPTARLGKPPAPQTLFSQSSDFDEGSVGEIRVQF